MLGAGFVYAWREDASNAAGEAWAHRKRKGARMKDEGTEKDLVAAERATNRSAQTPTKGTTEWADAMAPILYQAESTLVILHAYLDRPGAVPDWDHVDNLLYLVEDKINEARAEAGEAMEKKEKDSQGTEAAK